MSRAGRAAGALAAVLFVFLLAAKLLDRPTHIYYYRVIDDHTIVVGVVTGPGTWTRLTGISEGSDTVTVQVSSMTAPLPGYGDDSAEVPVALADPIGGRTVIDESTGTVVPFTRCLAYLTEGCSEP
jgi:hypothetical protein